MTPPSQNEATQLLLAWSNGDQTALKELTPLVYAELRRLAEFRRARWGRDSRSAQRIGAHCHERLERSARLALSRTQQRKKERAQWSLKRGDFFSERGSFWRRFTP